MMPIYQPVPGRKQDGSVAVEAALTISLILVPLLAFMLFFGRYFWYYTVAHKAVHDAMLSMANLSTADVRSGVGKGLAESIIDSELADLDEPTRSTAAPSVTCWYRFPASATYLTEFGCNNATLTLVEVRASLIMTVSDPFLSPFSSPLIGVDGIPIIAQVSMRHVGR